VRYVTEIVPRISVLLPFRDAASTLRRAAASVLAEREVPLELVGVDDGSTDGSAAILEALDDPRVVLVRTGGVGVAAGLAAAAARATGAFLARMDADDESRPGRFRAQLNALENDPRLGVVGVRVELAGAVTEGMRRYVEWQNGLVTPEEHARDLFVESPLCHPSVMMRRSAYDAAGGYREADWPEDYDLWLRVVAAGYELAKLPRVLFRWHRHEGQLTFRDPRYDPERFRALKARFLAPRLTGEDRPFAVWGAGQTGRRLARALEREGATADRFVDIDPQKIGGHARGRPIVAPDALDRRREVVVVAVGAPGAREIVRAHLAERGWREGLDFLCAA
jgi:glycosyltransferase involved in cell wall biosynthesis